MLGKVRGSDSGMSQSRAPPSPSSARGSNDTEVNTPQSVGKRRALRGSSWEVKLKTPKRLRRGFTDRGRRGGRGREEGLGGGQG